MYIIVAGCGRVGSQLADLLSFEGHDVVIIDKDRSSFRRLGTNFNGITLEGIAFDEEVLLKAGIEDADAFAAVTNQDNTNLMSAEIASTIYSVPNVISRLYNPGKEMTFFKMGIEYVCGTTLMVNRMLEMLFQGEEVILQQDRSDLGLQLVEFAVGVDAEGKPAENLNFGVSSRLVMLVRNNRKVQMDNGVRLRAGDRVVVTMRKEGWQTIRECLGDELQVGVCPGEIIPVFNVPKPAIDQPPEDTRVVIGGCSQVGSHLGYILAMEGYRVVLIDDNPQKFKRLPRNFHGDFLEGTVYDEEALIESGIEDADAFAAVTKFDNTNLMATEVARHVFQVPSVLARLFNPDKETTFQALGLNYVCGTRQLVTALMERVLQPMVRTKTTCFNNMYDLVEFDCPEAWDGRTVSHAVTKSGISFAYISRRSTGLMPDENLRLKKGDTIYGLASPRRLRRLEENLRKLSRG